MISSCRFARPAGDDIDHDEADPRPRSLAHLTAKATTLAASRSYELPGLDRARSPRTEPGHRPRRRRSGPRARRERRRDAPSSAPAAAPTCAGRQDRSARPLGWPRLDRNQSKVGHVDLDPTGRAATCSSANSPSGGADSFKDHQRWPQAQLTWERFPVPARCQRRVEMVEQGHRYDLLSGSRSLTSASTIRLTRAASALMNSTSRNGSAEIRWNRTLPCGVDQERAVERLALEVVVGPVALERLELRVGEHRHGELDAVRVVLEGLGRLGVVGADGDRLDSELLEGLELLAEDLELLHAVGTLAAQEEDHEDLLALVLGERPGLPAVSVPASGSAGKGTSQRAEGRQVDPVRSPSRPSRWPGPARRAGPSSLVGLPPGDDRLEAAEDRQCRGRPIGPSARAGVGLARLLLLADGLEDLDLAPPSAGPGRGSARRPSSPRSRRTRSCGPPGGRGPAPRAASRSPWRTGRTPGRPRRGPGAGSPPAPPGRASPPGSSAS